MAVTGPARKQVAVDGSPPGSRYAPRVKLDLLAPPFGSVPEHSSCGARWEKQTSARTHSPVTVPKGAHFQTLSPDRP